MANKHTPDTEICLVLCDYGQSGLAYMEADPRKSSREETISDIISGQICWTVRQIVAFNSSERWANDITEDVANVIYNRAIRKDLDLSSTARDLLAEYGLSLNNYLTAAE